MMPSVITTVTCCLLQSILFVEHISSSNKSIVDVFAEFEDHVNKQFMLIQQMRESLNQLTERQHVLRKALNKFNDVSRVASFELNHVPRYCQRDEEKLYVVDMFAKAIGQSYSQDDILEVKHFLKKPYRHMNEGFEMIPATLNYVVKVKTYAQKVSWMKKFREYALRFGWTDLFQFPGVTVPFETDENYHPRHFEYLSNRFSLVNVTLRDHLSPFRMSLMAVIRGKIKPKRHQFKVYINNSRFIVAHLLPLQRNVPEYVDDFSDLDKIDHLLA